MTYRDILVHMDESPQAALRTAAACELAARFDAMIAGVFLTSEFALQYMATEALSALPPDRLEEILKEHAAAVDDRAEAARVAFEAAGAKAGVDSEWLTVSGDLTDPLVACARRADLTVFPKSARACLGENEVTAASLGLACGGPVLVTPDDDYAPPIGRRVLVAWNGKREAARALRDAWPLIYGASELHVLTVGPEDERGVDSRLQRHLERHGCKANLIVDPGRDESAAEVVQRTVAELDADLLVMGLYGHSRLQELVLGGVSRQMLAHPPIPILISH